MLHGKRVIPLFVTYHRTGITRGKSLYLKNYMWKLNISNLDENLAVKRVFRVEIQLYRVGVADYLRGA